MGYKLFHLVSFFNSQPCLIPLSELEPRSRGAGAASRYGSGSDQMMRLRLRNTDLHSGKSVKKVGIFLPTIKLSSLGSNKFHFAFSALC
jgi:hypothetical protein